MNTKARGDISEAKVLAALVAAEKTVLVPWGDNQRYDLVVEADGGNFSRIQVKTGALVNGRIKWATASTYAHRGGSRRDYNGDADSFAVYCPDNDKVYLVPVGEVGVVNACLRLSAPKNGQKAGIRWAEDYELV